MKYLTFMLVILFSCNKGRSTLEEVLIEKGVYWNRNTFSPENNSYISANSFLAFKNDEILEQFMAIDGKLDPTHMRGYADSFWSYSETDSLLTIDQVNIYKVVRFSPDSIFLMSPEGALEVLVKKNHIW